MSKAAFLAALIAGSSPTLAQPVTSLESANPTPKSTSGDPNRIICERIERTGSRLQVDKVCMTATQWKDHQDGHRADVEKVQQTVNQNPTK